MKRNKKYKYTSIYIILIILLIILLIASIFIGRLGFNISILFNSDHPQFEPMWLVIRNIRLPRILGAIIIGASLAITGAVFQAIFKNPLVSPNILGSSNASAFGIALGIVLNLNYINTVLIAFILGIFAVVVSYLLSRLFRSDKTFGLILSGIMVSTIFSSLLSYIKLIADTENELPDITYWLMGETKFNNYDKSNILIDSNYNWNYCNIYFEMED